MDPNSASPLASCRKKHPPKNDTYQPYVGAATVTPPAADTREWKGSHVVNYEKIWEAERAAKIKEQEEEEEKKEQEMFKKMTPEAIKEFKENEHHHHEDRGPLFIEKPHDCDFDPNDPSPLASCRAKHPPKPTSTSWAPYDLNMPPVADLHKFKKPIYTIPDSN